MTKPKLDFDLSTDKKTYTFKMSDDNGSQTMSFSAHRDKDQTEIMVNTILNVVAARMNNHYDKSAIKEESPSPALRQSTLESTYEPKGKGHFFEDLVNKWFYSDSPVAETESTTSTSTAALEQAPTLTHSYEAEKEKANPKKRLRDLVNPPDPDTEKDDCIITDVKRAKK